MHISPFCVFSPLVIDINPMMHHCTSMLWCISILWCTSIILYCDINLMVHISAMVVVHDHHHLFLKCHFFHAKLGLDVCPYEVPPYIPENCPLGPQTKHFHVVIHASFQVFLFLPSHLTPATSAFLQVETQSSHSYNPDAQTTSIYHTSPHLPHSVHPKDYTNPHCIYYSSMTLHTSISHLISIL